MFHFDESRSKCPKWRVRARAGLLIVSSAASLHAQSAHPVAQPTLRNGRDSSARVTPSPILDADATSPSTAGLGKGAGAFAAWQTDHERVVGRYGVGLLGVSELSFAQPDGTTTQRSVAILGVRHWFSSTLGLQLGLGLGHHSGSASDTTLGTSSVADPNTWALATHVGVPIAIFHDTHYAFLLLPEAGFAYAAWQLADDANTAGNQRASGKALWLALGARLGAEIQFGFINLPMLSLQGAVGARLTYSKTRLDYTLNAVDANRRHWTLDLETANFNDPWDLFVSSITALYYF
ncbi:MAG TPA: hypothetical protein VIV60_13675 [Polyangiaceae bacterium]